MEWARHTFDKPHEVSSVNVYRLDEEGNHRVPESWRVMYRQAETWKPVDAAVDHGVATDPFNSVRFESIVTGAPRLEVKLRPNRARGVL